MENSPQAPLILLLNSHFSHFYSSSSSSFLSFSSNFIKTNNDQAQTVYPYNTAQICLNPLPNDHFTPPYLSFPN